VLHVPCTRQFPGTYLTFIQLVDEEIITRNHQVLDNYNILIAEFPTVGDKIKFTFGFLNIPVITMVFTTVF